MECYICKDDYNTTEKLYQPCKCKTLYVHEKCLFEFININNNTDIKKYCLICKEEYNIEFNKITKIINYILYYLSMFIILIFVIYSLIGILSIIKYIILTDNPFVLFIINSWIDVFKSIIPILYLNDKQKSYLIQFLGFMIEIWILKYTYGLEIRYFYHIILFEILVLYKKYKDFDNYNNNQLSINNIFLLFLQTFLSLISIYNYIQVLYTFKTYNYIIFFSFEIFTYFIIIIVINLTYLKNNVIKDKLNNYLEE